MNTKKHKYSFRISQGKYKGMSLESYIDSHTRPTKTLVKKSFFDTMRFNLKNSIFIECFAGSGQMGFEALSLGAKKVVFFEKNHDVFLGLTRNIKLFEYKVTHSLKLSNNIGLIDSYNMDFLLCKNVLSKYLNQKVLAKSVLKNDIIASTSSCADYSELIMYIDPPFSSRSGFQDIYVDIASFLESLEVSLLDCIDVIVIEMMSDFKIFDKFGIFRLNRIAKFGRTSLAYFEKD